ncbi:exo-beta-N-acetylmuramidase NamZ family protein [Sphingobacterium sp. HJSM2_6]|uniref:exo-beta-N-acetylmuramidase NamZ family protein n=1 Tax=Sphingobacterium sp. HJSM2_6 TaxID=3366264 RepID=UPI003BBC13A3
MKISLSIACLICWSIQLCLAQINYQNDQIKTGAEQFDLYLPKLQHKRVALVANQTSIVGNSHLLDTLLKKGVQVVKVFGPEHGFRGNASNGTEVTNEIDLATGIPIISLYGKHKKPTKEDLSDVDIVLFDIQDVGCRFYTYNITLRDIMESMIEHNKPLLVLDRPNPNGYLIDGPILDMKLKSGIGQFPVPISHGLTLGEFALMINGEGWMETKQKCDLSIVKVANYHHDMMYRLPVPPSPNLNTDESILLYPSTCLFEGIAINYGRGTDVPFTILGGPMFKGIYDFTFTPVSKPGMAEDPLFQDQLCYGIDLKKIDVQALVQSKKINISWLKEMYANYEPKDKFFDRSQHRQIGNIDYLVGVADFKKQIENKVSEAEIRKSWEPGLKAYKKLRKKYLLYP